MADDYKRAAIEWVQSILSEFRMKPAELARRVGVRSSTISRPLQPDYPHAFSGRTLAKIAKAMNRPLPASLQGAGAVGEDAWAMFAQAPDMAAYAMPGDAKRTMFVLAPELPPNAEPDPALAVGFWPFDRVALSRAGVKPDAELAVFQVRGAAMAPTLVDGDRVLVDRDDTRMLAGGLFALWDGEAVIVRRLSRAPGPPTEPKILISADSQLVNDRESEIDWMKPIGRAVLVIRRIQAA